MIKSFLKLISLVSSVQARRVIEPCVLQSCETTTLMRLTAPLPILLLS